MNNLRLFIERNLSTILIIVLGLLIYSNTLQGDWQYDDFGYILHRQSIRDITNINGMYKALVKPVRFVAFLSFSLNYFFHQYHVWGYHLLNIIIHISNALLVKWLAQILLVLFTENKEKRFARLPTFTALLFLTHPINTQAVSYISQRFTSLATMFYLLAVCFYLKCRSSQSGQKLFLGLFILFSVMGMYTKQITMTIPLMVLMLEIVLRYSKGGMEDVKKIFHLKFLLPLLVLFLIIPSLYSFNLEKVTGVHVASSSFEGEFITGYNYFLTQSRVVMKYLQLLFFPINQNFYYAFSLSKSIFEPATLLSMLFLLGLFSCSIYLIVKRKFLLGVGILWFFIALLVESSIVPIKHVIFEHRMYLSSIGFSLFFVTLVMRVCQNRRLKLAVLYFCVGACALLTYQRNFVWADGVSLWSDVVSKTKNLSAAYNNLGFSLSRQGLDAQAVVATTKAIEINPEFVEAYMNRGVALHNIKQFKAAVKDFTKAIELNPENARAYDSRSLTYQMMGEFELEIEDFKKSLSLQPQRAPMFFHEGNRYRVAGDYIRALANYQKALIADPQYLDAHINRGGIFLVQQEYQKALDEFQLALKIDETDPKIYNNIGLVYLQLEDYVSAFESFHKAIHYKNDYIDAYNNRANTYRLTGNFDSALIDINKALSINNRHAGVYYSRSLIYRDMGYLKKALEDALRARSFGLRVSNDYLQKLKYFINNPP